MSIELRRVKRLRNGGDESGLEPFRKGVTRGAEIGEGTKGERASGTSGTGERRKAKRGLEKVGDNGCGVPEGHSRKRVGGSKTKGGFRENVRCFR